MAGDFNEILNTEERIGLTAHGTGNEEFRSCVQACGLEDVPFNGIFFTWNNKQQGASRICSKIDCVLSNDSWQELFGEAEVIFGNEKIFDHSPAMITCRPSVQTGRKVFRYFHMWKMHPTFENIVRGVWQAANVRGTSMY